jgi:hypothetical protein
VQRLQQRAHLVLLHLDGEGDLLDIEHPFAGILIACQVDGPEFVRQRLNLDNRLL